MIGINLRLFDGSSPQEQLTNIQAMWWDVTEPKDGYKPVGKTNSAVTDQDGYINLDLSNVTGLTVGEYGFLMLYKLDAADHEDSLVFAGRVQTSDIVSGVDMAYEGQGWIRPSDWPEIDQPIDGVEKFQGVYAVYDVEVGRNGVAFMCEGAYNVDWGDGTSEDFATGVTAEHVYDFSNETLGQVTSEGYKCAVITVTPQSGNNLTVIDFNKRHSNYSSPCTTPWLDLSINGPYLTALSLSMWTQIVRFGKLQQIQLGENSVEDFSYFLRSCFVLQSIPRLDTSKGTNFNYFMYSCNMLMIAPMVDTSKGTSFSYFMAYCFSLLKVPLYDTSNGETFDNFLKGSYTIQSVPHFNTSKGTNFKYFLSYCFCLPEIPLFDTSKGTDFSYFLIYDYGLTGLPLIDTSSGSDFSNFLKDCTSLRRAATSGPRVSISYAGLNLGPDALNEIYENLGTGVTATITVTGNWGVGSDDPTKVPAGWTVVG